MSSRSLIALLFVGLAGVGCTVEPDAETGFVIAATDSYAGGVVFLDGNVIGELQHFETHGGLFETALKKIYGDSPAFHVVALKVDVAQMRLGPGKHELRVVKSGHPVATGTFRLPFEGQSFQSFFVNGSQIEAVTSSDG